MRASQAVRVRATGAVTALGFGAEPLWRGLAEGHRALSGKPPAGRIDRTLAREELARRRPDFASRARGPEEVFAALALALALDEGKLEHRDFQGERTAVILGTTKGAFEPCERAFRGESFDRASALGPLGSPARFLADLLGARGEVLAVSQACASGSAALAHGARLVASGEADRAIVGGVEALVPFVEDGFASLQALDPVGARPFDRARAGLSLGEGAGLAILERADSAERGLFLRGWGSASDAKHMTAPDPEGSGLARAVEQALARGQMRGAAIDVVCAHGTGTQRNDAAELAALARALAGARAHVFSMKGHIGHTLGAAGALDAIAVLLALEHATSPATAGLADPEPAGALVLPRERAPLETARFGLSVNAGFGGLDVALAFERVA